MLNVENISKVYRKKNQEIKAIDNLSMKISSGDFVSIIGSSGSGKSSLLLMLGGMLSPTNGSIWLGDCSLYSLNPKQRAIIRKEKIGFVFQTFNLIPYLTALQNVQIPLLLKGFCENTQKQKAIELLTRLGLSDRLEHKPTELSVGQQQRVALARTLANDPAIILADEPTGNLDNKMSQQVINFFEELNQEGKTIILVTHDKKVANLAKRKLVITEGKLFEGY